MPALGNKYIEARLLIEFGNHGMIFMDSFSFFDEYREDPILLSFLFFLPFPFFLPLKTIGKESLLSFLSFLPFPFFLPLKTIGKEELKW